MDEHFFNHRMFKGLIVWFSYCCHQPEMKERLNWSSSSMSLHNQSSVARKIFSNANWCFLLLSGMRKSEYQKRETGLTLADILYVPSYEGYRAVLSFPEWRGGLGGCVKGKGRNWNWKWGFLVSLASIFHSVFRNCPIQ